MTKGLNIPGASKEMEAKFLRILSMDLDQLNEAYILEMKRLNVPIVNFNQPPLDEIYRVLIPELFELAQKKRDSRH